MLFSDKADLFVHDPHLEMNIGLHQPNTPRGSLLQLYSTHTLAMEENGTPLLTASSAQAGMSWNGETTLPAASSAKAGGREGGGKGERRVVRQRRIDSTAAEDAVGHASVRE